MQLISGFIDTYLQLSRAEESIFLRNTEKTPPRERKKVMEIVTSWMKEGLRRGRKEGRQEGRQEGELALVLRLLNHRFDRIGARLQSRIRKLPLDKLEELAEALLDFKSADDIAGWLDEHQPVSKLRSIRKRTDNLK